jgi:hypothetical protein
MLFILSLLSGRGFPAAGVATTYTRSRVDTTLNLEKAPIFIESAVSLGVWAVRHTAAKALSAGREGHRRAA